MKKIISLFLIISMCFTLVACGGGDESAEPDETTEETTLLKITDEMKKEIEAETESSDFNLTLSIWVRAYFEGFTFTDVEINKFKLVDEYTYVAYGVIHTEDDYGEKYEDKINFEFTAEEDSSDPKGYKLSWDADLQ